MICKKCGCGIVAVEILDSNESPQFPLKLYRTVPENSNGGTKVGLPIAPGDEDFNQVYLYELIGGGLQFEIGANTGQLYVKSGASLDYEGLLTLGI